jgi:hypothetical protein
MNLGPLFESLPERPRPEPGPEPPGPSAAGYDPGHPWYYKCGGKPLPVDEIRHMRCSLGNPGDAFLFGKIPKNGRAAYLAALLKRTREDLAVDVAKYNEVVEKGEAAVSRYDLMMGYSTETGLSLTHNHISFAKGIIKALEDALALPL